VKTILCGLLVCLASSGLAGAIPESEREALISLYWSTGGSSWIHQDGWLGPPGTECAWYGVSCDPDSTHVYGLDLSGNGLSGWLSSIGWSRFARLESLRLAGNDLYGSLPVTLYSLSELRHLDLSDNSLRGVLPAEVGLLPNLNFLDLSGNALAGDLPAAIGLLSNLRSLNLDGNALVGELPTELVNLSELAVITFEYNGLFTSDPDLAAFLDARYPGGDHAARQVVPPAGPTAIRLEPTALLLTWPKLNFPAEIPLRYDLLTHWQDSTWLFHYCTPPEGSGACRLVLNQFNSDNHSFALRTVAMSHPDNHNRVESVIGPWREFVFPDSSEDPGASSSLKISGWSLNAQRLPPQSGYYPVLLSPGESLSGEIVLTYENHWAGRAPVSLGFSNSWDPPEQAFQDLGVLPADQTTGSIVVPVQLPVPLEPGRYSVMYAFSAAPSAAHLFSLAADDSPVPLWEDHYELIERCFPGQTALSIPVNQFGQPDLRYFSAARLNIQVCAVRGVCAHMATSFGWDTCIDIVTPAGNDFFLTAIDSDGTELEKISPRFSGPIRGMRGTLRLAELFSAETLARDPWLRIDSREEMFYGTITFTDSDWESTTTLPLKQPASTDLLFPYVAVTPEYYTGLTLVNPGRSEVHAALEAISEAGELLATAPLVLSPGAKHVRLVEELFNLVDPAPIRQVKVHSDEPLAGFELIGSYGESGVAGLLAWDLASAGRETADRTSRLVYNGIAPNGRYFTGASVSTAGENPVEVHFQLYDEQGAELATKTWTIEPRAQLTREVWDLFGQAVHPQAAWFCASAPVPLHGFELFLSRSEPGIPFQFEGLAGASEGAEQLYFPLVEQPGWWENWLYVTNLADAAVTVEIEAFRWSWGAPARQSVTIAPSACLNEELSALFPTLGNDLAWLRLTATGPMRGHLMISSLSGRLMKICEGQPANPQGSMEGSEPISRPGFPDP